MSDPHAQQGATGLFVGSFGGRSEVVSPVDRLARPSRRHRCSFAIIAETTTYGPVAFSPDGSILYGLRDTGSVFEIASTTWPPGGWTVVDNSVSSVNYVSRTMTADGAGNLYLLVVYNDNHIECYAFNYPSYARSTLFTTGANTYSATGSALIYRQTDGLLYTVLRPFLAGIDELTTINTLSGARTVVHTVTGDFIAAQAIATDDAIWGLGNTGSSRYAWRYDGAWATGASGLLYNEGVLWIDGTSAWYLNSAFNDVVVVNADMSVTTTGCGPALAAYWVYGITVGGTTLFMGGPMVKTYGPLSHIGVGFSTPSGTFPFWQRGT